MLVGMQDSKGVLMPKNHFAGRQAMYVQPSIGTATLRTLGSVCKKGSTVLAS